MNAPQYSLSDSPSATVRRTRSWLFRSVGAMVLLAIGATSLLPMLVRHYLRQRLGLLLAPYVNGTVHVTRVSLGWWSPLELHGVDLACESSFERIEHHSSKLGRVDRVQTDLTLWQLLGRPTDFGTVHIIQPRLVLAPRGDSWNWMYFLAPLLEMPPSKRPWRLQWEVHEAEVQVLDHAGLELVSCHAQRLQGSCQRMNQLEVKSSGEMVIHSRQESGTLGWQVDYNQEADRPGGRIVLECQEVPAQLLKIALAAFRRPVELAGSISGRIEVNASNEWKVVGKNLAWRDGWVWTEGIHPNERIPIRDLVIEGKFHLDQERPSLELNGNCDWMSLRLSLDIPAYKTESLAALLAASRLDGHVELDVASLASHLRRTLHVHEQLELESGRFLIDAQIAPQGAQGRCRLAVQSRDFAAVAKDARIVWPEPLAGQVSLCAGETGWHLDELECQTEFGQVALSQQAAIRRLRLAFNLERLSQRLAQFFDWGVELRGRLDGYLDWQPAGEVVQLDGRLDGTNCALAWDEGTTWESPAVVLVATAQASQKEGKWYCLACQLSVSNGPDTISLVLQPPLSFAQPWDAWWQLDGRIALTNWANRLASLLGTEAELEGQLAVQSRLRLSPYDAELASLSASVRPLAVRTHGWAYYEMAPEIRIDRARFAIGTAPNWELSGLEIRGSSAQLVCPQLVYQPPQTAKRGNSLWEGLAGRIRLELSFGRFAEAIRMRAPPDVYADGSLSVECWLQDTFECRGWLRDLQLWAQVSSADPQTRLRQIPGYRMVWRQPQVDWHLTAESDTGGRVKLPRIAINGVGWDVDGSGALNVGSTVDWQIDGQLGYDWQQVAASSPLWDETRIRVRGQRRDGFNVRGTFALAGKEQGDVRRSASLQGQASLGWDRIETGGIVCGAGTTEWQWDEKAVRIATSQIPANDGLLSARLRIERRDDRWVLLVEPGRVLERVAITAEMCHSWLKYVHPLVAEATRAEGRLGIEVVRAEIPLDAVTAMQADGKLLLDQGMIGPGPLAKVVVDGLERIAALADRRLPRLHALANNTWIDLPQQEVPMMVDNGRVTHETLRMVVGDIQVVSRGSVGLDKSLAVDLEVRVPELWTENRPLLARLLEKPMRIPIRGTLRKPQIDERFFVEMGRALLGNEAGGLLEEGLLRGLDRLFKNR
ncbi:MAG: hypothetical protein KatS3mg110_1580 [Pirellulaceae bacterium]|nr:MAG: hypothetical protein KatS3mg110_1580 [Pirellulaceae bacterium]